jgi:hypothetical protein
MPDMTPGDANRNARASGKFLNKWATAVCDEIPHRVSATVKFYFNFGEAAWLLPTNL